MSPQELRYYRKRAELERQRAVESTDSSIAEIHLQLASLYEKLVELQQMPKPTLSIV